MSFSKPKESIGSRQEDMSPLMSRMSGDNQEEEGAVPEYGPSRGRLGRRMQASTVVSQVWALRSVVEIVLLVTILALLASRDQGRRPTLQTLGDLTGFAPRFGQQIKKFAPDSRYTPEDPADWFKDSVRHSWLDLVPKGLGYVRIDNIEDYDNLPTPLPEYEHPVFTTSVTHQLHCLYKLQEFVSGMLSNATGGRVPESAGWHAGHCFEYLRQSILCCGDTALEGKQTTFPPGLDVGSDGWDAKHVCRDYGQIRRHLEKYRVDDKVWI